jgi:hypothetical protein
LRGVPFFGRAPNRGLEGVPCGGRCSNWGLGGGAVRGVVLKRLGIGCPITTTAVAPRDNRSWRSRGELLHTALLCKDVSPFTLQYLFLTAVRRTTVNIAGGLWQARTDLTPYSRGRRTIPQIGCKEAPAACASCVEVMDRKATHKSAVLRNKGLPLRSVYIW